MGILDGKYALVTGVATKHSIAWGITQSLAREGAHIALSYQNEKLKSRVEKLAKACNADMIVPCDAQNDDENRCPIPTFEAEMATVGYIGTFHRLCAA